jgi:predicted secreted protein
MEQMRGVMLWLMLIGILTLVTCSVAITLSSTIQIPIGEMFMISPLTTIIGVLSIGILSALAGIAAVTGLAYWLDII